MPNLRLIFAGGLLAVLVSGCANLQDPGNEIHWREDTTAARDARPEKFPVTMRIAGYADARGISNPRQIGTSNTRILGITGKDILLDREVTEVVAASMKKRLTDDGLQVVAGENEKAQFQLSGTVKVLTVDIKERDTLSIAIESTLTEVASGRVVWSGVVTEKSERYAGVSGNSKGDVAAILRQGLNVTSRKTSESILSVLMGTRPELFGLAAGVKPVTGVSVYATGAVAAVAEPPLATNAQATGLGILSVKTLPERVKVYVDDIYFGLTPLQTEMSPGVYTLRFNLDGYRSETEKISVRNGARTEMEVKLQR